MIADKPRDHLHLGTDGIETESKIQLTQVHLVPLKSSTPIHLFDYQDGTAGLVSRKPAWLIKGHR